MPQKADRRLYLTADRSRVVEEGDPDSATLLVGVGDELTDEHVKQYSIKVGAPDAASVEVVIETEEGPATKAQRAGSNKAEQPADDKGAA